MRGAYRAGGATSGPAPAGHMSRPFQSHAFRAPECPGATVRIGTYGGSFIDPQFPTMRTGDLCAEAPEPERSA